jgi:hypothetical protein
VVARLAWLGAPAEGVASTRCPSRSGRARYGPAMDVGAGRDRAVLLGPWPGMHHHNAQDFVGHPPSTILDGDRTHDAVSPLTAGRLALCATRLLPQQKPGGRWLAPPFPCLPHGPGAGNQGHHAAPVFQAHPQGPLARARTINHQALGSRKPQRAAGLNGAWGFDAITRVAIADAHAPGPSAIATHPQTLHTRLQIIAAILTMALRGARGARDCRVLGLLRVGRGLPRIRPIPGHRRGLLPAPGSGDGYSSTALRATAPNP